MNRKTEDYTMLKDGKLLIAKGEKEQLLTLGGSFFNGLISDILNFFETKKASFSPEETIEVIRLRDAALNALISPEIELIF